jgi:DNA adenine methylase
MILRRLGNKKAIAHKIIPHFPPHKIFISPFFGAGGIYFNKPRAKYNILNDLDSDVFNLFQVVQNNRNELLEFLELMPFDQTLFNYWTKNKETDKIAKAARFLFLSNCSFMGVNSTMQVAFNPSLNVLIKNIINAEGFARSRFTCLDFKDLFKSINYKKDGRNDEEKTFIYCDPPYLSTTDNYSNSFTEQDTIELFEVLIKTGCKFAISEFDNPIVLELAKKHGLEVITIGERQNLKNRRTEILIVNYRSPALYSLFNAEQLNNE